MIGNVVARRYASALYAVGKNKGMEELQAYGKALGDLGDILEQAPELVKIFRNPIVSVEEKKAVAAKLLDQVKPQPAVRNFVNLLADKERLSVLPEIEAYFRALLDADLGVLRGRLVTAVELSEAKRESIQKQLEGQAGRKLVLDYGVDPAILGGVVLEVGDRVLDASLRAQLGILKETIKRGE